MPAARAAGISSWAAIGSAMNDLFARSAVSAALMACVAGASAQAAATPPAKAETCVACHGVAGLSQLVEIPSLAGQPEGFLQWQMVYFRSGTRKSPRMQPVAATLTDDDIRELSAYFSALPAPASATDDAAIDTALYDVGRRIAQAHRCGSCHRDDFGGAQAAARTSNQREDYLLKALRDFKSGKRTGGGVAAMADVVYRLDDDELRALAHFMAHLR